MIGSACEAGELYRAILEEKPEEEIDRLVKFYDYLEIQPLGNNAFMVRDSDKYPQIQDENDLMEINRKIVSLGEEYNKLVVATCDVHFLNPEDEVYRRMESMKKDLPEDVTYSYGFDNTKFIRASINEVKETVYVAFILVIIIIFLFLRDWRVTLVPCIVIPVSLIGAFFVMYLAGFSINVLSMLAIVLAVGLVVDDAIVMTENIYIRIEKGMSPKEAGIEGAKEIFFAVISTTITLVAVFFPIVFMQGMTGIQYCNFRFCHYLFICGTDFHTDAGHEVTHQT